MPCAARAALAASRSASRRPPTAPIQMIMATVTTILRGSSTVLAPRRERGEKSKCDELLLLTVLNSSNSKSNAFSALRTGTLATEERSVAMMATTTMMMMIKMTKKMMTTMMTVVRRRRKRTATTMTTKSDVGEQRPLLQLLKSIPLAEESPLLPLQATKAVVELLLNSETVTELNDIPTAQTLAATRKTLEAAPPRRPPPGGR